MQSSLDKTWVKIGPLGPDFGDSGSRETQSAILASPFFDSSFFRVDWLHAVDKGTAAFFIGSPFDLVVHLKDWGPNIDARCSVLWRRVLIF